MKAHTVSAIHDFTLKARELLEKEISEQLEGTYGLLPDGSWESAESYPALSASQEAKETRNRLEQFLGDENAAGIGAKHAHKKLVREAAFTWLNRLVAFKMMEARKLLRQTISRGQQSNAFLMWLTEPGNEEDYKKYEQGDLPQNAFGEGPRQEAYRYFLLWQCGQLAREIKVLFDPDNLVSRLFPRPQALNQLIEMMNAPELEDAWAPGNEETIGWVYQGFNSEELEKAFREVRVSGRKFEAEDIPSVTQLFTPRWIVRFLVENTLGRLWIEMHPDSRLSQQLEYLIPSEPKTKAPFKLVRDIKFLDPACGTMHFGLVAFDIFAKMYQEEFDRAGEPGWPERPSVADIGQIPAYILSNNIHGIDIDKRAVQLSALTLFLKAKSLNPDAVIEESKLASASIQMLDGSRMEDFLQEVRIEGPTLKRILIALHRRLRDVEQLGSLLRLEEEIQTLLEKERERYDKEGRQISMFGWPKEEFETEAGQKEFWETLRVQVEQSLHLFAKAQAEKGKDQSFFANETTKGLRLLEVLSNRYDVVVTNPPYMSNRKMNNKLKELIASNYPEGKGDLYASFILRCLELAADHGRVGMLTMHSFMFISSYEKLRQKIRNEAAVESLAHLGPALFSVGNPGTLQTAAHILRREKDEEKRQQAVGTYFRLVKEPDGENKRRRFEEAIRQLRTMNDVYNAERGTMNDERETRKGKNSSFIVHNSSLNYVFIVHQSSFDSIPGSPWVYWITPGLRRLFKDLPKLEDVAQPRVGLQTGDNSRFLRYWWEVGTANIGLGCRDAGEAMASKKKWFPYMKGGSFKRWYGNQEYVVNWENDGAEVKTIGIESGKVASRPQNTSFYFRPGVTWTDLTSGRFSARLSPGGFIFDVKGSSAFPNDIQLVLGLLNCSFAHYCLSLINPTVSFQVGDLARLPIPKTSSPRLHELVEQAIELAKADSEDDETTYDFIAPPDWPGGNAERETMNEERETRKGKTSSPIVHNSSLSLAEIEREIDEEVYRLYGISDEDREAIEQELGMMNDER